MVLVHRSFCPEIRRFYSPSCKRDVSRGYPQHVVLSHYWSSFPSPPVQAHVHVAKSILQSNFKPFVDNMIVEELVLHLHHVRSLPHSVLHARRVLLCPRTSPTPWWRTRRRTLGQKQDGSLTPVRQGRSRKQMMERANRSATPQGSPQEDHIIVPLRSITASRFLR